MKCIKCGSTNLRVVASGPHNKLVCGDCFTYQKFLSKADAKTFKQLRWKYYTSLKGDSQREGHS